MHTGSNVFPTQLLVGNSKKINRVVVLPRGLSLSLFTASRLPDVTPRHKGVRIHSLESALAKVGPAYSRGQPQEIALALQSANRRMLLENLLEGAQFTVAGRLAGAYRAVNLPAAADEIVSAMRAAELSITETNPFDEPVPDVILMRPQSPHATRIALLWDSLSDRIASRIDPPTLLSVDIDTVIEKLEETYTHDAYHSLSIEGYRVTPDLIDRVRSGQWNPEDNEVDQKHLDTLAARGYWEAHNEVKESVRRLHSHQLSIEGLREELARWYRALFGPMVRTGMLDAVDLAGYRNRPVFIRGSRHTPLPAEALTYSMETLFNYAEQEPHPLIRAILCHWLIGYIHPFPDGNGRSARFLMNALLVTAGYPWTIIRMETRSQYMSALEELSVNANPDPFVEVILEAMHHQWMN